ncbi:MAG: hypothetical protein HRF49_12425, partial [bacterium]
MNVHDYYVEQSYGKFEPRFSLYRNAVYYDRHDFTGPPYEPVQRIPEFEDKMITENNYLADPIAKPLILFGGDEDTVGWGSADILQWSAKFRGDKRDMVCGMVRLALANNQLSKYSDKKVSLAAYYGSIVSHEIGHLLNWPDTYNNSVAEGPSSVLGVDLMGSGGHYAPLGVHKVYAGWTCFINIKHNSPNLISKPQDLMENEREIYFLKLRQDISDAAEFYYMENQAGGGSYVPNDFWANPDQDRCWNAGEAGNGLVVPRVFLPHYSKGDIVSDWPAISIPSIKYTIDNGTWSQQRWAPIFPFISNSFGSSSIIKSNWHDGKASGINIGQISFLENRHPRPYLQRFMDGDLGYGDIICDVDVGNPLYGDFNGDGVVNEGDENMLRANIGRRVGIDPLAVPLDVNGDGEIGLARDRDRDGFIATSERIYDDGWTLVHSTGDWLDLN